jgi:hypothetical protein
MLGCGDAIKCVVPPQPRRRRIVTLSCVTIRSTGVDVVPSTPPPGVRGFYDFYPHGLPRATGTGEAGTRAPRTSYFALDSSVGSRPGPLGIGRLGGGRRRYASRRVKSCVVWYVLTSEPNLSRDPTPSDPTPYWRVDTRRVGRFSYRKVHCVRCLMWTYVGAVMIQNPVSVVD